MYDPVMKSKALLLKEAQSPYITDEPRNLEMVRTQIYLTAGERSFVQREGERLGKPMAAVIRDWIEEKMKIPEDAWKNSPLLDPPADPDFEMPEDAAINHDHYVYGGPKKYKKVKGKWIHLPMLP
jgi:hypothetical protein